MQWIHVGIQNENTFHTLPHVKYRGNASDCTLFSILGAFVDMLRAKKSVKFNAEAIILPLRLDDVTTNNNNNQSFSNKHTRNSPSPSSII